MSLKETVSNTETGRRITNKCANVNVEPSAVIFYILAAVPVVPVVWSIPLSIALLIDRKNISFPTKALLVTSVACQGWIIAHTGQELIDIFQEGAWWKHLLQLAKDA